MINRKQMNGITLIALIVTIIVLLILAGISIMFIVGNNGILSKAKDAKDKTSSSQETENMILSNYSNYMDDKISGNSRGSQEQASSIITDIDFLASSITQSSAKITITVTATNESDIMGYHIICTKASDTNSVVSKISETKEITITGFEQGTSYNIYVIGYDKFNHVKYSTIKSIKTQNLIDFVGKLNESSFQSTGNNYYSILQSGGGYWNGYSGVTSYPVIDASDTNSYTCIYSKNKLENNLKTLDIEVRTRNDGTNNGPCAIGLVSNPGVNPTWITNAYASWTGATTSSWTTYKTTITIPTGINSSDYYFEIYLGHAGSHYTMWMDFQTLKGYY